MGGRIWLWVRRGLWMLLILVLVAAYWLLPIQGGVLVIPGDAPDAPHWPVVRLSPASPRPGHAVDLWVTDIEAFPHVKLVVDGETDRLLGGQIIGRKGVAKRVDVLATALHSHMTINELRRLDLSYAPPFAPVWDPILVAANVAAR